MPNEQQLKLIQKGPQAWNSWRKEHPDQEIDLSEANLSHTDLRGINFSGNKEQVNLALTKFSASILVGANFSGANLYHTYFDEALLDNAMFRQSYLHSSIFAFARLWDANFEYANLNSAFLFKMQTKDTIFENASLNSADLREAKLVGARFIFANLSKANLEGADLQWANLYYADLSEANLKEANLQNAILVRANLDQAILNNSSVFGVSAWEIRGNIKEQKGLIVNENKRYYDEPTAVMKVDDLEISQFVYLLLNRKKIRNVLNTITSKAVLILGRFTPERKIVLDAMAEELRKNNLLPIIFDFEGATSRDFTETIKTMAGISLFIIADLTNPSSAPLELQATVPDYRIPFVPIIQHGEKPFAMLWDLIGKYNWVLEPITYPSLDKLLAAFKPAIIDRAWHKHQELQKQRSAVMETLSIENFLKQNI